MVKSFFSVDHILFDIDKIIKSYNIKQLYIAYSGGVDSTALLHIVSQLKQIVIYAVHIHHGLSNNADNWSDHCRKQAELLKIDFVLHKLKPPKKKTNIENWARLQRYTFFKKIMFQNPKSLLLTGHHLNDQAETFLFQALRGSGLKGLSSIAKLKPFASGWLLRPFLHITKFNLITFCQKNLFSWIQDESNDCDDFLRNKIRHNLIPRMNEINPSSIKTLARSAQICAEADLLLYELLGSHLKRVVNCNESINLLRLNAYSILQQKYLLKMWLTQMKCYPSYAQFFQIYLGSQKKKNGWHYLVNDKKLLIHNGYLVIKPHVDHYIDIPHNKVVNWMNKNLNTKFVIQDLNIRKRKAGDRCRPINRHKSQILKIIFQENNIGVFDRKNALIITTRRNPEKIIAVYPFFQCY